MVWKSAEVSNTVAHRKQRKPKLEDKSIVLCHILVLQLQASDANEEL